MDKLHVNQTGGFPMTTNILNAMQNAYNIFNALGNLAGNFTIISGCVETGSNVSDGVVFINGEVLPFRRGTKISKVRIVENTESKQFEDGTTKAVVFKRFVEFGTGVDAIDFSNFKRLDTILQIMQRLTVLENDPDDTVEPATQAEVNARQITAKYVSPATLPQSAGVILLTGTVSQSGAKLSHYLKAFASQKLATGKYKITHNLNTTQYGLIGAGTDRGNVKISLWERYSNYCIVGASDDSSLNDAAFSFQIFKVG